MPIKNRNIINSKKIIKKNIFFALNFIIQHVDEINDFLNDFLLLFIYIISINYIIYNTT